MIGLELLTNMLSPATNLCIDVVHAGNDIMFVIQTANENQVQIFKHIIFHKNIELFWTFTQLSKIWIKTVGWAESFFSKNDF